MAYRLDLTIDPAQPRFSGHVEIAVALDSAASEVFLHGRDLTVHRVAAQVGARIIPATWSRLDSDGAARVAFAEPLPAGPATLVFDYDALFGETAAAALVAAARSSRTDVASWMLGLIDPRLRTSERLDILDGVMARRVTRPPGYDWIVANLDSLLKGAEGHSTQRGSPRH